MSDALQQWSVRYRPRTVDDLIAEDSTKHELKSIIAKKDKHALLVAGPYGCGKTTIANLLACGIAEVPYGPHPSIKDINVGDKRTIDDMRSVVETSTFMPQMGAKRSVIILDECFPAGTQVLMSDGSTTSIETLALQIDANAEVASFNHITGEIEPKRIISGMKKKASTLIEIELEDGTKQRCSPNHKWWSVTRNEYVFAKDIKEGEELLSIKPVLARK